MGAASLGGIAFERGGRAARRARGSVGAMFGQALAHLCLAAPGLALYLIILPRVYGFSTLGSPFELLLMAIPFVLAVSFLAQFVASGFKRRETAVLTLHRGRPSAVFPGRRLLAAGTDTREFRDWRAAFFPALPPSTGSSASTRWARASAMSRAIG